MKQIFLILIILFFSGLQSVAAIEFTFNTYVFADWGNKQGQTSLVDIDKDGDLDWVVGERGNGNDKKEVSWFEFQSADTWIRHTLGTNTLTDVGGVAFDIDGDGWIDQASGGAWYRNPQTPLENPFTRYTNGAIKTHDNVAADIDGDGILDLVSMNDDTLRWYKIPSDPTSDWIETTVSDNVVHGSFSPRGVGDIDGDGDNDIVQTTGWYRNEGDEGNEGDGSAWTFENIDGASDPGGSGQFKDTTRSWIFDIDLDGDNDIVMATADTPSSKGWLRWFENENGDGRSWESHSIARGKGDLHSLVLADFDNDEDIDIFTGEGPMGGSGPGGLRRGFIFENVGGKGGAWLEHIIVEGYEIHEAQAGDVDGDGDIDIVFKPWNGGEQVFLENVTSSGRIHTNRYWCRYFRLD
ncbi:MAG: VCBS repeat-containing protein [Nitrospirae bacterium]|nr:VCBS repeat-containing protein [Candidatus Manganitrophaceae bacterium]